MPPKKQLHKNLVSLACEPSTESRAITNTDDNVKKSPPTYSTGLKKPTTTVKKKAPLPSAGGKRAPVTRLQKQVDQTGGTTPVAVQQRPVRGKRTAGPSATTAVTARTKATATKVAHLNPKKNSKEYMTQLIRRMCEDDPDLLAVLHLSLDQKRIDQLASEEKQREHARDAAEKVAASTPKGGKDGASEGESDSSHYSSSVKNKSGAATTTTPAPSTTTKSIQGPPITGSIGGPSLSGSDCFEDYPRTLLPDPHCLQAVGAQRRTNTTIAIVRQQAVNQALRSVFLGW